MISGKFLRDRVPGFAQSRSAYRHEHLAARADFRSRVYSPTLLQAAEGGGDPHRRQAVGDRPGMRGRIVSGRTLGASSRAGFYRGGEAARALQKGGEKDQAGELNQRAHPAAGFEICGGVAAAAIVRFPHPPAVPRSLAEVQAPPPPPCADPFFGGGEDRAGTRRRVPFYDGSRGIFRVCLRENPRKRAFRDRAVGGRFLFLPEDGFPDPVGGRGEINAPDSVREGVIRDLLLRFGARRVCFRCCQEP